MSERGFLYAATGERWILEAIASATQLRCVHPDATVILHTDAPELARRGPFDDIVTPPEGVAGKALKLSAMRLSPFERTIFLDTDTYPCADLTEAFDVLDRFDVAGVPVPRRRNRFGSWADTPEIPPAVQDINSGMLAWRMNVQTAEFLDLWWELYQEHVATLPAETVRDQASMRVALWRSNCHVLLLPPEYNMRTWRYSNGVPYVAVGPVRLIHGRPDDFGALARRWNASTEARIITQNDETRLRQALRQMVPRRVRFRLAQLRRRPPSTS